MPRRDVTDGRAPRPPRPPTSRARVASRHEHRRRLLDDFLMPALDRALAVEEVQDGAVGVAHDLYLDVPRVGQVPLHEHLVRSERSRGLALGRLHGVAEPAGLFDEAHAAASPAGRRLDQQRVADTFGEAGHAAPVVPAGTTALGSTGTPAAATTPLAAGLVAHDPHGLDGRADPHDAGVRTGLGQVRVLREEPVAGMQRIRPARQLRPPRQRAGSR